jgi:surface antigen
MKNVYRARVAIACLSLIGGCDTIESSDKETIGATAGAAACGVIGTQFGTSLPTWAQPMVVAGGAVACGYVGKQIGAYLDEQDRQSMNEAAQQALKTGKVQSWSSPDGKVKGSAQIVRNAVPTDKESNCKTIRQTVTLANGSKKQEDLLTCKGPDGRWAIQQDAAVAGAGPAPESGSTAGGALDWAKDKAGTLSDAISNAL